MLARAEHRDGGVPMQVVRGGYAHCLHIARRDRVEARRPGATEALTGATSAVGVLVADQLEPGASMRRQCERVVVAPDASADDGDADKTAGGKWQCVASASAPIK